MKKIALLTMLVVLVSGCAAQDDTTINRSTYDIVLVSTESNPTEIINIEAVGVPVFVREGKIANWNLRFVPEIDITDLKVLTYDPCSSFEIPETEEFEIGDVRKSSTKQLSISFDVKDPIQFERKECTTSFRTSFSSTHTMTQAVVVLSDADYEDRLSKDTLSEISLPKTATTSPLTIKISFNPEQPLLEEDSVLMYLDYSVNGQHTLTDLESGDIEIQLPENLELDEDGCTDYDYDSSNHKLTLNDKLRFFNGKSTRSTCSFTTIATPDISTGTLKLDADYTYTIDKDVSTEIRK